LDVVLLAAFFSLELTHLLFIILPVLTCDETDDDEEK